MIRKACVAGRFYPEDPATLLAMVKRFLGSGQEPERALAAIAPHAGYMYSGAIAGAVYSSVKIPDDIILIGPNHTGLGDRASIMPSGSWETPAGDIEINPDLAGLLLDANHMFTDDRAAHLMEHSIEVQLPFLRALNKAATIVPITVMHAHAGECEELGRAIARAVVAWDKEVLIIVSSDMNHYESDKVTREKDRLAIGEIMKLDPRGLLNVAASRGITMCGAVPAAIAMEAARQLGASGARLVKYGTSGETSGDLTHVVGYAGIRIA